MTSERSETLMWFLVPEDTRQQKQDTGFQLQSMMMRMDFIRMMKLWMEKERVDERKRMIVDVRGLFSLVPGDSLSRRVAESSMMMSSSDSIRYQGCHRIAGVVQSMGCYFNTAAIVLTKRTTPQVFFRGFSPFLRDLRTLRHRGHALPNSYAPTRHVKTLWGRLRIVGRHSPPRSSSFLRSFFVCSFSNTVNSLWIKFARKISWRKML